VYEQSIFFHGNQRQIKHSVECMHTLYAHIYVASYDFSLCKIFPTISKGLLFLVDYYYAMMITIMQLVWQLASELYHALDWITINSIYHDKDDCLVDCYCGEYHYWLLVRRWDLRCDWLHVDDELDEVVVVDEDVLFWSDMTRVSNQCWTECLDHYDRATILSIDRILSRIFLPLNVHCT
jgi:hypothetical protein